MLLQDPNIHTALISQFNGAVNADTDSYSVDPAHGLYARNVRYGKGLLGMDQVGTRLGHAQLVQIGASDGPATSLTNWYFVYSGTQFSLAIYYASAVGIRGWQQSTNTLFSPFIVVVGAAGSTMVPTGQRLYAAFFDITGRLSTYPGQVYGWGIGADVLFAPPISVAPIPTFAGAGGVTAGQHGLAYLTTTRNGYVGRLQPVNASTQVFDPTGFGADGVHAILVTITLASLPSYLSGGSSAIQVVMTTASNPNRWFTVPGAIINNPIVGANTVTVNIDDASLAATGEDVTSYLNTISSTTTGTSPFFPSAMFTYSSRMGYVTIDAAGFPVIYISDPNKYQKIAADRNAIYLDGVQKPIQGVSLHSGTLFIATLDGFFQTSDNGGDPVSWTPPFRVDGSVGIQAPPNLLVNSKSGYILVASTQGLYLFQGGVFPELPLSYYQNSDWQRINWAFPTQVQVAEDGLNRVFHVIAPLTCTITGVTNANPAVVTTAQPHLFQTGLTAVITGTGTSIDGARAVTRLTANTFSVPLASGGVSTTGKAAPTSANADMSWDYTDGYTPQQAQYSLRAFTAYRQGAVGNIFNTTNGLNELWYAPGASNPGCLIRQKIQTDANPYSDVNLSGALSAIDDTYQTSNTPGSQDETSATVHDFHGAHLRAYGSGSMSISAFGLDGNIVAPVLASPVTLTAQEGKELLVKWFLRSEQQTLQFGTNAIDEWFVLSLIRAYYSGAMPQR